MYLDPYSSSQPHLLSFETSSEKKTPPILVYSYEQNKGFTPLLISKSAETLLLKNKIESLENFAQFFLIKRAIEAKEPLVDVLLSPTQMATIELLYPDHDTVKLIFDTKNLTGHLLYETFFDLYSLDLQRFQDPCDLPRKNLAELIDDASFLQKMQRTLQAEQKQTILSFSSPCISVAFGDCRHMQAFLQVEVFPSNRNAKVFFYC